ncbi:hypothetical protein VOLCADRAFT_107091 [Volvox carteri f. nagariensis]|uniref:Uncharacterized protein n=1 Tax=Volvox carteri f. nagariensis TaxID=3068 RepID=D8UBW4_VOLCA|nr:uncharacterized protein VOLCADRAFT_107091 [Volvox carteri f. nagariensis]EFJ42689.1 hypothetical protein VOLCADRAFT_107091 [Volvox carteri f. nagariensis]|eukprot:XP_002956150.1 hypothetical protein VOLCADRAFT_107091 [Volvox carteri f. nagariensis]
MTSRFPPPTSQKLDVAFLTFLIKFLSKPIVLFDNLVLHPAGRERPLYLLIYSVLSRLALLNFGQRSLVISEGPDDPWVHLNQEAPEDEQQQESRNVEHGRSEFVVLRVPPQVRLPEGYNLVEALQRGGKAVMLVKVKSEVTFKNDIWQPLATALELAIQNETDPVTLLLTDASSWYFATVQLVQKIDNKRPPLPKGNSQAHGYHFQACGHEFCLFDWVEFKCKLLYIPWRSTSSDVPEMFAHMYNVLYPGEDITQVADRAKLGRETLRALAVKWAKPVITDMVTSQNVKDLITKEQVQQASEDGADVQPGMEAGGHREEDLASIREVWLMIVAGFIFTYRNSWRMMWAVSFCVVITVVILPGVIALLPTRRAAYLDGALDRVADYVSHRSRSRRRLAVAALAAV